MKEPVTILKEALLTEKATMLSANLNQYVFRFIRKPLRLMSKMQLNRPLVLRLLRLIH